MFRSCWSGFKKTPGIRRSKPGKKSCGNCLTHS